MQTIRLTLVREGEAGPQLTTPDAAVEAIKDKLRGLDREHFLCVHMDVRNRVIGCETVAIGSLSACIVHPREVFKAAILSSAASILLAHNHPSDDLTPSKDDMDLTKRLVQAGTILGIEVIDHIIVCEDKHLSLRERGIM